VTGDYHTLSWEIPILATVAGLCIGWLALHTIWGRK
jgi:uncharacterized membrane-anchored protein YhcB (DUF1043 family)